MTTPLIRFAGVADLPGVLALYAELRPQDPILEAHTAQAKWREILAQPSMAVVVAELGGTLAASCMIALVPNLASNARSFAIIEHVVTLAAHRGQGLGRAVMQHALDFAWDANCCKVMLLSGAQREDAHRLYERLGFAGDVERGFVAKPPLAVVKLAPMTIYSDNSALARSYGLIPGPRPGPRAR